MTPFLLMIFSSLHLTSKNPNNILIQPIVILSLLFLLSLKFMYMFMPKMNYISSFLTLDLMSSSLYILTIYLVILCYITSSNNIIKSVNRNSYSFLLWSLCFVLMMCFCFKNIFWFYISFECALIPTILLIIGWGYQEERFQASFYLIMFTIFTSLPMLLMLMLLSDTSTPTFVNLMYSVMAFSPSHWSVDMLMWAALTTVFLVKLPIYLFHLWLPKAHVEAPVVGSMLLAGILLKLGGYGFMRFASLMLAKMTLLSNVMAALSIWGALLTAMICTTQVDMKALIAYSSITHMSLMMLAMVSSSLWGWYSALTIMISHGLCSSGLFSTAGLLYDYTHTRNLFLNKGMLIIFPPLMIWLFIMSAFNFGAPPSMNMMGEIMAITASNALSLTLMFGLIMMLILAGWYSVTLYMSISHGQLPSIFNPMTPQPPRTYLIMLGHVLPLIMYLFNPALVSEWI